MPRRRFDDADTDVRHEQVSAPTSAADADRSAPRNARRHDREDDAHMGIGQPEVAEWSRAASREVIRFSFCYSLMLD